MTVAALRGGTYASAEPLSGRVDAAVRALSRPGLVYLYWGEVDKAGHHHGSTSWQWGDELEALDRELVALVRSVPRGTLVLVTADHGMVDVDPALRRDVATDPALSRGVELVGGEPRAVHVYTEPGQTAAVAARWRDVLGDDALVLERDEVLARGFLGPDPARGRRLRRRRGGRAAGAGDRRRLAHPDARVAHARGRARLAHRARDARAVARRGHLTRPRPVAPEPPGADAPTDLAEDRRWQSSSSSPGPWTAKVHPGAPARPQPRRAGPPWADLLARRPRRVRPALLAPRAGGHRARGPRRHRLLVARHRRAGARGLPGVRRGAVLLPGAGRAARAPRRRDGDRRLRVRHHGRLPHAPVPGLRTPHRARGPGRGPPGRVAVLVRAARHAQRAHGGPAHGRRGRPGRRRGRPGRPRGRSATRCSAAPPYAAHDDGGRSPDATEDGLPLDLPR